MKTVETLTLYETLYFYELERKDKITNRIQLNFALIIITYTAFSYMIRTLDYESRVQELFLFLIFLGLSIFASSIAIYLLIKSYWNNPIHHIASPNEIGSYIDSLRTFYNNEHPKDSSIKLNNDIEEYISNSYREAANRNMLTNEKRNKDLYTSFKWLLISAFPLAIASLLFLVLDLDASSPRKNMLVEDKNLALEIKKLNGNLECIKSIKKPISECSEMTKDNVQQPTPPSQPQTQAKAPEKPSPPQLRMAMESLVDNRPLPSNLVKEEKKK